MTKMRQWSLLTGLAILVILIAGWMLVVKPQHATANNIQSQATSVQQHNSLLANQVASLRARSKDLPAQQAKLAAISVKIPDNPALPGLIRSLTSAATGAGVDLVTIAPATPIAVTPAVGGATGAVAAGPTSAAAAQRSAAAQPLTEIPVTLTVQGTYFTVEQFFFNLENLQRALRVTQFSLSPGGAKVSSASSPGGSAVEQLTGTITAQVYMAPDATTTTSTPVPGTK